MDDVVTLLGVLVEAALVVLGALSAAVGGPAWLTLYSLLAAAGYAVVCYWWPVAKCGKCEGKGRFPSPSGKYERPCPRCKGKARKMRFGRRVLGWLSSESKS